ncbi:MAG: hypothetical protein GC180_12230 [Bacteroidetes bacterium]|nr:hypothetical protein [Bacteroidota bacterium]
MIRQCALLFLLGAVLLAGDLRAQYDSTKNGRYKLYNDSHQLILQGRFKSGLRHGTFKEYDMAGLLILKAHYKNGKLLWMQRYANGKIIEYIDRKGRVRKAKSCGC